MKPTGIVRKIDELGRVVIPIELRRIFDIKNGDPVEILTDNENIVLKKFESNMACVITGEVSLDNKRYCDGKLILSPEGLKQLLDEAEEESR